MQTSTVYFIVFKLREVCFLSSFPILLRSCLQQLSRLANKPNTAPTYLSISAQRTVQNDWAGFLSTQYILDRILPLPSYKLESEEACLWTIKLVTRRQIEKASSWKPPLTAVTQQCSGSHGFLYWGVNLERTQGTTCALPGTSQLIPQLQMTTLW